MRNNNGNYLENLKEVEMIPSGILVFTHRIRRKSKISKRIVSSQ